MVVHFESVGFRGQAIEPSLKPLFGKNAWSLHDSLCRRGQGILDDILALLLMEAAPLCVYDLTVHPGYNDSPIWCSG